MLVLTRRVGEEIVIDGGIRVLVVGAQGDRVRIGVAAPNHVRIDRREIHERRSEFDGAADPKPVSANRLGSLRRLLKTRHV